MRTSNNANFIYSVHANHLEESHLAFVQAISMNLYKLDRFFFFLPTQKNLASCCSSFSNVYNIAKVFSSAALPFVHRSCQFSEDFPQFCNVTPPTSDKLKRAILQRKQNSEKMPKSNRQNACLKLHSSPLLCCSTITFFMHEKQIVDQHIGWRIDPRQLNIQSIIG